MNKTVDTITLIVMGIFIGFFICTALDDAAKKVIVQPDVKEMGMLGAYPSPLQQQISELTARVAKGEITQYQAYVELAQATKDSSMLQEVPLTAAVYVPEQKARLTQSQLKVWNMAARQQLLISKSMGAPLVYE